MRRRPKLESSQSPHHLERNAPVDLMMSLLLVDYCGPHLPTTKWSKNSITRPPLLYVSNASIIKARARKQLTRRFQPFHLCPPNPVTYHLPLPHQAPMKNPSAELLRVAIASLFTHVRNTPLRSFLMRTTRIASLPTPAKCWLFARIRQSPTCSICLTETVKSRSSTTVPLASVRPSYSATGQL